MQAAKFYIRLICVTAALAGSACNGRPSFDIHVYDFESNCNGVVRLKIEHDPEPEVRSIKVEPAYSEIAQHADISFEERNEHIVVRFASEVECVFPRQGSYSSSCVRVDNAETVDCSSTLQLYSYRYPSRGPGYNAPIAEFEGDEVLQADLEQEVIEDAKRRGKDIYPYS